MAPGEELKAGGYLTDRPSRPRQLSLNPYSSKQIEPLSVKLSDDVKHSEVANR